MRKLSAPRPATLRPAPGNLPAPGNPPRPARQPSGTSPATLRPVAVGTALAGGPPHRSRRAELPHRAPALGSGVEARVWVGVRDAGSREPSGLVPVHPLPGHRGALAAAPQRLVPVPGYLVAEGRYRPEVTGDRVVRHVPAYHAGQPAALFRDGLVHAFPELFLDPAQRRPQPFRDGDAP